MKVETAKKILEAQERIDRELTGEYGFRQERFLKVLQNLSQDQRSTVLDYLGVCIEIHLKRQLQA